MTKDKSIFIKNIYYMLAYSYQNLLQSNYKEIQTEAFDNVLDLFAAILARGIASQLKQGLYKEYVEHEDELCALRGKIDMPGTIRLKMQRANRLQCAFDEFSDDNPMNRILKTTSLLLLTSDEVKRENQLALKRNMPYLSNIGRLDPMEIDWRRIRYNRNNQAYRMLMNLCYLTLTRLLLTTEAGKRRLTGFLDSQSMERLYEKFILEYFRKHHPDLRAAPSQVAWNLDDGMSDFLPDMKTDITLTCSAKTLIIDAKYYTHTMQTNAQFDARTIHSANLYQIYAYVKNKDVRKTGNVSGLLLYAKTDEEITPDCVYRMDGNRIGTRTLDLNCDFNILAGQLDRIATSLRDEAQNVARQAAR